MGVLLQPDCSLGLPLGYGAATDHFGMFTGLDSMFAQYSGNQSELVERSRRMSF